VRGRRTSREPLLAGHGPLAKVSPVAAFALVMGLFLVAVLVRGILGAVLLGGRRAARDHLAGARPARPDRPVAHPRCVGRHRGVDDRRELAARTYTVDNGNHFEKLRGRP
jgi:hypothetical protein